MATDFITTRIAVTLTLIEAYEAAVLALGVAGGTQSYRLDTGQSVTQVTRADIPALNKMIETLYNRYEMLSARCTGSNVVIARPAF